MTAPRETPAGGEAAEIARRVAAGAPDLVTDRLGLRAPRIGDFAPPAGIVAGPRGVDVGGPMGSEETSLDFAQGVAGSMPRGHGLWSVERRADGGLIGFAPLDHESGDPDPEPGYPSTAEAEGQGFAAEAVRAFAFERLGWRAVASYVDPANVRSVRLAERLGARGAPGALNGAPAFRHDAGGARA